MPTPLKTLILAAAMALFSGCAALEKPLDDTDAASTAADNIGTPAERLATMHNADKTDINWLFGYYRLINTVNGKVLASEYERTKKEFSGQRTAKNQWRLAMLLSIPGTSFYDAGRSSDLFKELTNNDLEHDPRLNDAAFMMHTLVNEQHRIFRRSDTLEAQLAESQAANKKMQNQLDALKAIEDTLYQRNKAEVKPKP